MASVKRCFEMFRLLKNGISALNVSIFLDFDNPTIIIILQNFTLQNHQGVCQFLDICVLFS